MNAAPRSPRRRNGFTLVEVLVVVAIIAIAGAVVVPSMLSAGTLGLQGAARMIVADLQYAQNEALATGQVRGIEFDPAADSYRMFDENDATLDLTWMRVGGQPDAVAPGGRAVRGWTVNFQNDRRFTGVNLADANFEGVDPDAAAPPDPDNLPRIEFDALGAPSGAIGNGTIQLRNAESAINISVDSFTGAVTIR